jgi:aminopeptidase
MPRDPRLEKLANILVKYSTKVRKGDAVGIAADPVALPLADEVVKAVIKAGGLPIVTLRRAGMAEALAEFGSDEQLSATHPVHLAYTKLVNVHFTLWGEENSKNLSRYDAKKLALFSQGNRETMREAMRRSALPIDHPERMRWVGTLMPTQSSAQDAEMSLSQYEDFVFRAGLLHEPDPVAAWERVHAKQERIRAFLQSKSVFRFRAPACDSHDGTDLTVDCSKSTWINCSGHENFPDGEVFTGPVEDATEGTVQYSFPAVHGGREVDGIRLVFRAGRVVEATAEKGEAFLHVMLDQDDGARVLGEVALGTNYAVRQYSKNTLFDEKIGGTFHAALGASYPESGGRNKSGLHWDMVCDLRKGGTVYVDGQLISESGRFLDETWPQPSADGQPSG